VHATHGHAVLCSFIDSLRCYNCAVAVRWRCFQRQAQRWGKQHVEKALQLTTSSSSTPGPQLRDPSQRMALEAESQALAEELSSFVDEVRNMLLDPLLVLKTITHG